MGDIAWILAQLKDKNSVNDNLLDKLIDINVTIS